MLALFWGACCQMCSSINKYSDTYGTNKDVIGAGSKWLYTDFVNYARDHDGIELDAVWPRIITLINCTLRTSTAAR